MAEIAERALNAPVAPGRTFLGHRQRQINDLLLDRGASSGFPAPAVVPVPPEDSVRSYDGDQLLEHLAPEDLPFDGQALALVIVKEDSLLPEFLSENPVLCQ